MTRQLVLLAFLLVAVRVSSAQADFMDDVRQASMSPALEAARQTAAELMAAGDLQAANTKILATFPTDGRTVAQSFVLGNVLFGHAPEESYALHKLAVKEFPDEPYVQLQWGLQQHRDGKYAEAAAAYDVYLKANPDHAPFWGLKAECLMRTGKVAEAVSAWGNSERARRGKLIEFESLVCEVNSKLHPHRDRTDLRRRVAKGELEAARKLVVLDAEFRIDWWNDGPSVGFMRADLELIRKQKWSDPGKLAEIVCTAETVIAKDGKQGSVEAVLKQHGFLFDDKRTLPQDGTLLSILLATVESSGLKSREESRALWGTQIAELARRTKHPDTYNVAAHLHLGTESSRDIVRAGWTDLRDARFAGSIIVVQMLEEDVRLDHPDLIEAATKFPEDAEIAKFLIQLTAKAKRPLRPVLEQAIKAEYTKFSTSRASLRRSSTALRSYFGLLKAELEEEQKTK